MHHKSRGSAFFSFQRQRPTDAAATHGGHSGTQWPQLTASDSVVDCVTLLEFPVPGAVPDTAKE